MFTKKEKTLFFDITPPDVDGEITYSVDISSVVFNNGRSFVEISVSHRRRSSKDDICYVSSTPYSQIFDLR